MIKGRYTFANVAPGAYQVRVVVTGFDTFEQSGVQVAAGNAATVNAQLQISAQRQDVTVHTTENAEHLIARARLLPDVGPGVRAVRRDAAGRYYVLTAPGEAVEIYSPAGAKVGQIPAKPTADSKIVFGEDFYLDSGGRIYVADRGANEIKIYAAGGALEERFQSSRQSQSLRCRVAKSPWPAWRRRASSMFSIPPDGACAASAAVPIPPTSPRPMRN